jgi:hypothetical protein
VILHRLEQLHCVPADVRELRVLDHGLTLMDERLKVSDSTFKQGVY